ncbi:cupredoxin domain-containing protein [Paracraurococcus lichenis]|uniref:cupredoxin domain-containing protein n=1 Tax=Paracraurococcus lichenis TaxID=3064888 RepID=UPI00351D2A1C
MSRPALTGLVLIGTLTVPLLCSAGGVLAVTQKSRAFSTREANVTRGTTVHFGNEDDYPHQIRVTGPGLDFESDLQASGEVVNVTLVAPGVYEVRCGIHPRMRMTISTH